LANLLNKAPEEIAAKVTVMRHFEGERAEIVASGDWSLCAARKIILLGRELGIRALMEKYKYDLMVKMSDFARK
jgi:hypothetical protein